MAQEHIFFIFILSYFAGCLKQSRGPITSDTPYIIEYEAACSASKMVSHAFCTLRLWFLRHHK